MGKLPTLFQNWWQFSKDGGTCAQNGDDFQKIVAHVPKNGGSFFVTQKHCKAEHDMPIGAILTFLHSVSSKLTRKMETSDPKILVFIAIIPLRLIRATKNQLGLLNVTFQ